MRRKFTNPLLAATFAMPLLAGCLHRQSAASQPVPQAPLDTEPDTPPEEAKAAPAPAPAATPAPEQAATPAPPVHHRKAKPSPSTPEPAPATAPQPAPSEVASAPAPAPTSSAIGELSAGDSASTAHGRSETATLIATTDKQLKEITRPLSAQEQKTAAQVRQFLQQSRDALKSQDVDAAYTLATKAKLLLEELLK
jgi:outer membrane biosynthesis protein TonB